MKSASLKLLVVICSFSPIAQAQSTDESPRVKPVTEFELFLGGGTSFQPTVTNPMWQKYFPDFTVPAQNTGYITSYPKNYGAPALLMSFRKSYRNKFLDSYRIRSSIGLITGLGAGYYSEEQWSRSTTTTIDSFTVVGNNETYPIDSVSDEMFSRSIEARDFMIGISQRFQTNPERRVTFHYGLDVLYGFGVNSHTSVNKTVRTSYTPAIGAYDLESNSYDVYDKKSFSGPKFRSLDVQFPLELAIKPIAGNETWNRFVVGFAFRPTVRWYHMDDEKGSLFQPWYGMIFRMSI